jgi:hypothetical protein
METVTITKGKRTRYYHTPPKYKYAVFAGESFYPAGGFDDFYGYATKNKNNDNDEDEIDNMGGPIDIFNPTGGDIFGDY